MGEWIYHRRFIQRKINYNRKVPKNLGELKVYGTFFDELCLLMIGFERTAAGLNYCGALGCRGRLELTGINYGLWAKGCYTEARRGQEFYTETIYT